MKANVVIFCEQCGADLGDIPVDTADQGEELQERVNSVILGHRETCPYYTKEDHDVETISGTKRS